MGSTSAGAAEFQDAGKPIARPIYLVDASGNPISSTNALAVSATVTPAANQRVNAQSGDFVAGSVVDLATLLTLLQGAITSNKMATKAGAGDFIDLASILTALQGVLAIKRAAVSLFSTAQSTVGSGNSGDLTVGPYTEIAIDITTTAQAGTNPTIQFFWDRKGADGVYYPLWQSNIYSAASNTLSTSIGAGMAYNQSLGSTGRLRWVVGGTATPTWTFTPNVTGK